VERERESFGRLRWFRISLGPMKKIGAIF
jgi:hypothetical protein